MGRKQRNTHITLQDEKKEGITTKDQPARAAILLPHLACAASHASVLHLHPFVSVIRHFFPFTSLESWGGLEEEYSIVVWSDCKTVKKRSLPAFQGRNRRNDT